MMYMKTSIQLSVDVSLLVEARGVGLDGQFSKIFSDAVRAKINKPLDVLHKTEDEMKELGELKAKVAGYLKNYPQTVQKAMRKASFIGAKLDTLPHRINYYRIVLDELRSNPNLTKERTPLETQKEGATP